MKCMILEQLNHNISSCIVLDSSYAWAYHNISTQILSQRGKISVLERHLLSIPNQLILVVFFLKFNYYFSFNFVFNIKLIKK